MGLQRRSTMIWMKRLLLFLAAVSMAYAQTNYDLLLKGGHVIDPKNNLDALADVAIRDGKIAAIEPSIEAARAKKTIQVNGLYVTPGLVDIHVHLFTTTGIPDAWAGDNSIRPDDFSFRTGVTTMVDAGSSGWRNFELSAYRHRSRQDAGIRHDQHCRVRDADRHCGATSNRDAPR